MKLTKLSNDTYKNIAESFFYFMEKIENLSISDILDDKKKLSEIQKLCQKRQLYLRETKD